MIMTPGDAPNLFPCAAMPIPPINPMHSIGSKYVETVEHQVMGNTHRHSCADIHFGPRRRYVVPLHIAVR